eukprot:TRINITY_DN4369_c0_g1_i1.p1 TRINITY_DN4369_c0_g1~~TRINITY_DN4369_c0_g1_i1.p1  ORF type:complete len:211 (-),score=59.77 TRINITY_DN4369_c0_g1_i1:196-828(-)
MASVGSALFKSLDAVASDLLASLPEPVLEEDVESKLQIVSSELHSLDAQLTWVEEHLARLKIQLLPPSFEFSSSPSPSSTSPHLISISSIPSTPTSPFLSNSTQKSKKVRSQIDQSSPGFSMFGNDLDDDSDYQRSFSNEKKEQLVQNRAGEQNSSLMTNPHPEKEKRKEIEESSDSGNSGNFKVNDTQTERKIWSRKKTGSSEPSSTPQ